MRKRTKVLSVIAVVFAILGVAFFVLLRQANVPAACHFELDLTQARTLASSMPGAKPHEVRFERITTFRFPAGAVVTGDGWAFTELAVHAYQLVFPDRTIVVDTAMTEPQAKEQMGSDYDAAAWSRLSKAMDEASAIYVTHEHGDHLGGAAARLDSAPVREHLQLTREQLAHPDRLLPVKIPEAARAQLKPLEVNGMLAVAPGVVLISAPGHTPGSQLVFIQRDDGTEVLLLGDVAWHADNFEKVSGPPKLVYLVMHGDQDAVSCQLAALKRLSQTDLKVQLVPGHDGPRMEQLVSRGVLVRGFKE